MSTIPEDKDSQTTIREGNEASRHRGTKASSLSLSLASIEEQMADAEFLAMMMNEIESARKKHPSPDAMLAAIFEEGGEVAQAMMDKPWCEVRKECVHLAVTALRLAVEGDPTLRGFRVAKGLDYLEGGGRKAEGGVVSDADAGLAELNQRLIERTAAYEKREAEHLRKIAALEKAEGGGRKSEDAAPAGEEIIQRSDDWVEGYALGHNEGYLAGMNAAMPLPIDVITVQLPCPLSFMLSIMKIFSNAHPQGTMRQVGQWMHFSVEKEATRQQGNKASSDEVQRHDAAKNENGFVIQDILKKCPCGQTPELTVVSIGGDEYDEIECPQCNRMVRKGCDEDISAVCVWNTFFGKEDAPHA